MLALILIQACRNREDWGGEWGAAFQIFGKFDFLRTDTNNGRVENYKFVESSQKCITFVTLQYLCCMFYTVLFFIFFWDTFSYTWTSYNGVVWKWIYLLQLNSSVSKRLKTKMGFTTHKNWQNLLILLCVYQKRIFEIDIRKIPNDFIGRKDSQKEKIKLYKSHDIRTDKLLDSWYNSVAERMSGVRRHPLSALFPKSRLLLPRLKIHNSWKVFS